MRIAFLCVAVLAVGCETVEERCAGVTEFYAYNACIREEQARDRGLVEAMSDSSSMSGTLEGERSEPLHFQPASDGAQRCCKVCSSGKACGNSCISRSKTCHQPPGCACNL